MISQTHKTSAEFGYTLCLVCGATDAEHLKLACPCRNENRQCGAHINLQNNMRCILRMHHYTAHVHATGKTFRRWGDPDIANKRCGKSGCTLPKNHIRFSMFQAHEFPVYTDDVVDDADETAPEIAVQRVLLLDALSELRTYIDATSHEYNGKERKHLHNALTKLQDMLK